MTFRMRLACLALLPLICCGYGQHLEDIICDVSAVGDGSLAQARIAAQQQIAGFGPLYRSARRDDRRAFSGRYTPPELSNDKKGRYVYGLAVFSDDGCNVSVRDAPLHAKLGQGQHLPNLGESFKALPVALLPGQPVKIDVSYSNVVYMDDPKGPGYPDVDGCSLFLFLIATELVPDKNRDGVIDDNDRGKVSKERPFRWWVNDDDDIGDLSHEDRPLGIGHSQADAALGNNQVDGLCDLIDWFPIWFDLKQLLEVFPSDQYQYFLRQKHAAVNFVYTDLKPAEVGHFLRDGEKASSLSTAQSFLVLANGSTQLSGDFLAKTQSGTGVLLMEGGNISEEPLWLEIRTGGKQVFELPFHIRIDDVARMYRWINIRNAARQLVHRSTDISGPDNFPDPETNGKMFIFVHGYSVNEQQSEGSVSDAFKRLYQSGSNAMYTGVSWHGDSSQLPTQAPIFGGQSADYWENVTNVFRSSAALALEIAKLPGTPKVSAAHSLGNMLVASAIKDHGAAISAHFMFDAAVAIEAFDSDAINLPEMRNPAWAPFERKLWASEWHSLFDGSDGRNKLTWRNRFGPIPTLYNFYSPGENVLDNSDGTVPLSPEKAERAWALQEMIKGTLHPGAQLTLDSQAGWGFSDDWRIWEPSRNPTSDVPAFPRTLTPAEANAINPDDLKTRPFFRRFQDSRLTSPEGSAAANEYLTRGKTLAEAIPALSFAAGRNEVVILRDRNYDLMLLTNADETWPQERRADNSARDRWLHGDAKDVAFRFNYLLYEKWLELGGLK